MRIGVDLGGTKIEAVVLGEDGSEIVRRRIPAPQNDYNNTLSAINALIKTVEQASGKAAGECPVGVGIPGTISPQTGLVKNANSTWLIGHPLDQDLTDLLNRPVRIANDANCFALSESVDGAGAGADIVFGVILGTGVGGGLVVGGAILEGPNSITGEWGHNPLPLPSPDEIPGDDCYCGLSGCLETFLSGQGLQRSFEETAPGGGPVPTAEEIHRLALGEQDEAKACLDLYASRLARGLASVINIIDPSVIVLGGGLSNMSYLYEQVPSLWGQWVFSDNIMTKLLPNKHGDSSGVRGAAWLWPTRSMGSE